MGNLEQLQTKIVEAMKELSELMKKQELASFSIKHYSIEVWKYTLILLTSEIIINQTFYQLPLKIEAARIFCLSLTRNPSISEINVSLDKYVAITSLIFYIRKFHNNNELKL